MSPAALIALVLLSVLAPAGPAVAGGWFVGGYYGHPYHYHGCYSSFGFVYGGCYAPPPVVVAAPQVVYYAPPVIAAPPVIVQPPPVVQAPAPQPPAPTAPASHFIETSRRYHEHGDNEGLLDWVEGLLDGRPVRIYYDDFGRVTKQKWID
jgi:hypothetical protein